MCGIILGKDLSEKRINLISHRGIEYTKIVGERTNGNVVLAHHRLPIQTQIGDGLTQPIKIGKDRYMLFNGEIFNYPSHYESDTEYLVSLFKSFDFGGLEMFEALYKPHIQLWDGFWAIVLIDLNTNNLLAFTDPLGKKSLYINNNGDICSEIKGVINNESTINMKYISGVNKWGYTTDCETPWNNITRLKPNVFHWVNLFTPEFIKTSGFYYDFNFFKLDELDTYDKRMDWLWEKMETSVRNRLLSKNYPISVLLSGGLDSAIISGLLLKMGANVSWYTIENGEDSFYVNECEKYWNIKVNRLKYNIDPSSLDKLKDLYIYWNETPVDLGSVVPQYELFKSIKEQTDTRIVISGDGADELFGGYSRIDQYDSQPSDIFHELTYYHLPRLDKMSMAHTLELRSPFLNHDIVKFALSLPLEERKHKKILKDTFRGLIPDSIIERKKHALKNPLIVKNKEEYRKQVVDLFLDGIKQF